MWLSIKLVSSLYAAWPELVLGTTSKTIWGLAGSHLFVGLPCGPHGGLPFGVQCPSWGLASPAGDLCAMTLRGRNSSQVCCREEKEGVHPGGLWGMSPAFPGAAHHSDRRRAARQAGDDALHALKETKLLLLWWVALIGISPNAGGVLGRLQQ